MEPYENEENFSLLWLLLAVFAKIVTVFTITVVSIKVYMVYCKGVCRTRETLEGKTIIITGGNGGIGKETAKELARRKARVILACRNLKKAEQAAQEIFEETQQPVVIMRLDLASFKSVREFANCILKTEARLDVLINNAGVMLSSPEVELTEDGYEIGFQTNYLGHCLLTLLLLDLLKKSHPSRVVNLSSFLHHLGNVDNLLAKAKGTELPVLPVFPYFHSKLAIIMFTRALAGKLKGHGVTVNTVHPGIVDTEIGGSVPGLLFLGRAFIIWLCGKSIRDGAETTVYATVDPSLTFTTGKYFVDCREDWVNWKALDARKTEELFEATLKLVQFDVSYFDGISGS